MGDVCTAVLATLRIGYSAQATAYLSQGSESGGGERCGVVQGRFGDVEQLD
jgi:hypothetical protein